MRAKAIEKYERNKHYINNNVVAKEFSRKLNSERSTSRTFIRLKTCAYKKARQNKLQSVVRILSALCEDACEQNSRGLKIVKIYRTVVNA